MTAEETRKIISDTVAETVRQLKTAGLLKNGEMTAFDKTEALLRQYPLLKTMDAPYARRVVQEVDACLEEVKTEPYLDVIRLYYFSGLKNSACANKMLCSEKTCRRNRIRLVQRFSARLASEAFFQEVLGIMGSNLPREAQKGGEGNG